MPADAPASPAVETTPAASAPVDIITPQDATAERIARGLTPEQAKAFKANRAAQKAARAQAAQSSPAPVETPAAATPEAAAVEKPAAAETAPAEVETLVLGEDTDTTTTTTTTGDESPAAAELTESELSALDEKARKRYLDASKEAAKVRKRAQESEARAKELEQQLATLQKEAEENTTRSIGLTGNSFAQFKEATDVAKWGTNAQEAVALLHAHERQIKSGRADADATVLHMLPDGREVELAVADIQIFQNRINDARSWFEHDDVISKNRDSAKKLADKHKDLKGYTEARESYLKDKSLTARIDELVSKAALYDVLHSRKANISFPDTAAAATSAASARAAGSDTAHRKTPPSETPASTPRLAQVDSEGSDVQARKSLLMEKARTAKTEDERQKFLKEAIKLGPSRQTAGARR